MKKISIAVAVIFLLAAVSAIAAEKQVNLKGLYIGMPVDEAKVILKNNLGPEWKTTITGNTAVVLADYLLGNERIFGANRFTPPS